MAREHDIGKIFQTERAVITLIYVRGNGLCEDLPMTERMVFSKDLFRILEGLVNGAHPGDDGLSLLGIDAHGLGPRSVSRCMKNIETGEELIIPADQFCVPILEQFPGIVLGLQRVRGCQLDLFGKPAVAEERDRRFMAAVDAINRRWGHGTAGFAVPAHARRGWRMRRRFMSPRYTTCWEDLPVVKS